MNYSCNVCDTGDNAIVVGTLPTGRVMQCRGCKSESIFPLPAHETLVAAYQNFNAGEIAREEFEAYVQMSKAIILRDLVELGLEPSERLDFLDYGCGGGHFVRAATSLGVKAVGIDLDEEDARFGSTHGLRIELGDYRDLDARFGNAQFDIILMMHVLEHVPRPKECLKVLASRLKPGGALIIRVPDQKSFPSQFKIALRSLGIRSDAFGFVQPPIHLHGLSMNSFRVIAEQLNLSLVKIAKASALDPMEFPTTLRYWRNLGAQKAAYSIGRLLGSGGYLTAILRKSRVTSA
jgi:SAM-dependent methyltransferase